MLYNSLWISICVLSFTFGAVAGLMFNENDGTLTVFSFPPFETLEIVDCLLFDGLMLVCVSGVLAILVLTCEDDKSPSALRVLFDDGIIISFVFLGVDATTINWVNEWMSG